MYGRITSSNAFSSLRIDFTRKWFLFFDFLVTFLPLHPFEVIRGIWPKNLRVYECWHSFYDMRWKTKVCTIVIMHHIYLLFLLLHLLSVHGIIWLDYKLDFYWKGKIIIQHVWLYITILLFNYYQNLNIFRWAF